MIQVNGCEFKNIAQPIYVNRKRVKEVWVNGIMVYPELEIDPLLQYAMYFKFGSNVLSKYSSEPVDAYGAYIKFDDFVFGIYRVAFVVTGTGRNIYRQAILTYRGYVNGGSAGITYVPYISSGGVIVADGFSHSDINTFGVFECSSGGKYYYSTTSINVNLEDSQGNMLTNYTISTGSDNCKVFSSETDALNYVLG